MYPDNVINHYKVKLPIPLNLDRRKWEVAVSELHFPVSWHNISPPFNWFQLEMKMRKATTTFSKDGSPASSASVFELVRHGPVKIPAGVYSSVDLIHILNEAMKRIVEKGLEQGHYDEVQENGVRIVSKRHYPDNLLQFHLKEDGHVVFVTPNHQYETWLSLPEELVTFLGFHQVDIQAIMKRDLHPATLHPIRVGTLDNLMRSREIAEAQNRSYDRDFAEMTSMNPACKGCGFEVIYVYSSLVEDRVVGDTMAPLLARVPVSRNMLKDTVVTKSPRNMEYLGLRHGTCDHIEINIMNDTGELVPFRYGKAIVTLHFRPRRF